MTTDEQSTYDALLAAEIRLAKRRGLYEFSREELAEEAGTSTGTVSYHFGTMERLRAAVVRACIEAGSDETVARLRVLADALVARDYFAVRMPDALKARVADSLT